jgi:hypothetical protein
MKERTVKSAEAAYASFGAPWPYGGADRSTRPRRRLGEVGFSPCYDIRSQQHKRRTRDESRY